MLQKAVAVLNFNYCYNMTLMTTSNAKRIQN